MKWSLWSFHYRKQVPPPVRRPPDLMFVNDVCADPTLTRIHGRVAATSRACVCDANHANARTSRSLARLSVHVTYDPLHGDMQSGACSPRTRQNWIRSDCRADLSQRCHQLQLLIYRPRKDERLSWPSRLTSNEMTGVTDHFSGLALKWPILC